MTHFQYVINLKTYEESTGSRTENFMNPLSNKTYESEVKFALSIPQLHLATKFKSVISQHVDYVTYGAHTGHIIMEDLISLGVMESLLNHSERRLPYPIIKSTLERAKELNFGIITCSQDMAETEALCEIGAETIAYEPPELIGGSVSVSMARPGIIEEIAQLCREYGSKLLVGAGIKNRIDVETSKKLGAVGVLVSSGIVKSNDPFLSLNSLVI